MWPPKLPRLWITLYTQIWQALHEEYGCTCMAPWRARLHWQTDTNFTNSALRDPPGPLYQPVATGSLPLLSCHPVLSCPSDEVMSKNRERNNPESSLKIKVKYTTKELAIGALYMYYVCTVYVFGNHTLNCYMFTYHQQQTDILSLC